MVKRSAIRLLAALAALLAGVAISAETALAVMFPDPPIGPTPAVAPAHPVDTAPAAAPPADSVVILGMTWQLAVAAVLFALAMALFIGTAAQRRHVTHA
jgi:hypothetical protein